MSFDLLNYIQLDDHPQPDELTRALRQLFMAVRQATDVTAWRTAIDTYMTEAKRQTGTGLLHGWNAAGTLFVGEALAAGLRAKGPDGGKSILGFVIQLSMSEAQWKATQQAIQADAAGAGAATVLRVADFPSTVMEHLFKRGEREILREIYLGARFAIDGVAQSAMREASSFEDWQAHLGVLATYLTLRNWLPLVAKAEGDAAPPLQGVHPMLTWLFNAEEISELHQHELSAADFFSHLFSSHVNGMITAERQKDMAEEYAQRAAQDSRDAQQWLAEGKRRFELAPYLN